MPSKRCASIRAGLIKEVADDIGMRLVAVEDVIAVVRQELANESQAASVVTTYGPS